MKTNCSFEKNLIDSNTVSIKYIVGGWLTFTFCVSGIVTNIFTNVVLLHPRMRNSSTHVYLLALSFCNIFLLGGILINYSIKSIASYPALLSYLHHPDKTNRNALLANGYEQFYARAAPFTTPFLSMLLLCSTYFTVLVSGDRYFLICWPKSAEKLRTRRVSLYLVFVVFLLVNLYILPHWFEYRTEIRLIEQENFVQSKIAELTYTNLGSNMIYQSIYRFYLNVPVTFVIPFTLLTFCNGSMIHKLLLIRENKKRLGHRMRADIRITIMLIVIVLTFMVCRSFNLYVNLRVQLSPCMNANSIQRYNAFANLFIAMNGFINFFLFAAFGQRFREMVVYIVFRHGQSPFENVNAHRPTLPNLSPFHSTEAFRRQSRVSSLADLDLWMAIARRRPSATMAVLYNPTEQRLRTNSCRLDIPVEDFPRDDQNENGKSIPDDQRTSH